MQNEFFKIATQIDVLVSQYSEENFSKINEYFVHEGVFDYFIKKISKSLNTDWLIPLKDSGFFNPEKNPPPQELSDKKGFYSIPYWNVLSYLEIIAQENSKNPKEYITKALLEIVNKIIAERVDNYRTDWVMLTVMSTLPTDLLIDAHIEFIRESLQSTFKSTLVESDLGKLLIPKLIKDKAVDLLLRLIDIMLDFKKNEDKLGGEYISIIDPYWLAKALKEHKLDIAKLCGTDAASIAISKIEEILTEDNSRFIYRIPTIEDHPQIISPERYECQIVQFIRDMFEYHPDPEAIREGVISLLSKENSIFKRIAFHLINKNYSFLKNFFWVLENNPLNVQVKHEIYELLKNHCKEFSNTEIDKLLDWIETENYPINEDKETEDELKRYRAHRKKEWLSALDQIKNTNKNIYDKFEQYNKMSPGEIDHPGFFSWSDSGPVRDESPISAEKLCSMTNQEIAKELKDFKDEGKFVWGKLTQISITNTFKECVTSKPEKFSKDLDHFLDVQPIYIMRLLWGLTEVWRNKEDFEWNEILEFVWKLIEPDSFWHDGTEKEMGNYRNSIIGAISDLIEEGTKSDAHAFNPDLFPQAEKILLHLLNNTTSELQNSNDYVTSVLNSPKGRIYASLINYSLRYARFYKRKDADRWKSEVKSEFTRRLNRKIESTPEYSVILGQYMANLYYLDKQWVNDNIERIFLKDDPMHWEKAMAGYLYYASKVYKEIYDLLTKHGHYKKAIHTTFEDNFATERLIQHICIGFMEGWESLEENLSLISEVLENGDPNQLRELTEFIRTLRGKIKVDKVKHLWGAIMRVVYNKLTEPDFKPLASNLARLLALVDKIDDEICDWMKQLVKYFDKDHFNNTLIIEYLLKHVEKTPQIVGEIYVEMLLNGVYPLYKEEQIKELVQKLYITHPALADNICNMYGSKGHVEILEDVYREHHAL